MNRKHTESVIRDLDPAFREDAKKSAFLALQLEDIEAELYRVEYPGLKFRQFIPLKLNVNPGAETVAYKVYDVFGVAKFIAAGATDLPDVTIRAEKFASPVRTIGMSFSYDTQDLRAAAMAGLPLDQEDAQAAMEAIERLMDETAAKGDSRRGLYGFANHPNVAISPPVANGAGGGGSSTYFVDKTPVQILADLHAFSQSQNDATFGNHPMNAMIMPPSLYGYCATTYTSSTMPGDTILVSFLKTDPYVKSVDSWHRLETAGATLGPRIVGYEKDPRVVQIVIPMETVVHAVQPDGLQLKVPMEARFGGVVVRYPMAMRYMDAAGPVV